MQQFILTFATLQVLNVVLICDAYLCIRKAFIALKSGPRYRQNVNPSFISVPPAGGSDLQAGDPIALEPDLQTRQGRADG